MGRAVDQRAPGPVYRDMGMRKSFAADAERHFATFVSRARKRRLRTVRGSNSAHLCRCISLAIFTTVALATPAASASAPPLFRIDLHHNPTNFAPGASGDYEVEIANLGDTASSGPLSLRLVLPNGLGRDSIAQSGPPTWSCPGSPGDKTMICTTSGPIPRHSVVRNLILSAAVAPAATGERFASAKLEGGAAANPATAVEPTPISAEPATFGPLPNSFLADSFAPDGLTPIRAAGAHPAQVIVGLDLNTFATPPASPTQITAVGSIRHFQLALPPGFLGNPTAPGECTPAELTVGACPRSAQVGRIELGTGPFASGELPKTYSEPVFNMQSPHGVLADLAFAISGNPVHIKFSLDSANGYAILASAADVNETESLLDLKMTLWGVPADHSHDSERCGGAGLGGIDTSADCPTDVEPKPFLTVPSQCGTDQTITLSGVDSWQHPGLFAPAIPYPLPGLTTDCDKPRFEPTLSATPTVTQADSPTGLQITGLQIKINVPQNENPNALATPPLRDFHLTLPAGMRISPAAADGLASCTPAGIALGTNDPVACPDASRVGAATITTPLLPEPLQGFIYLASPHDNPTNSLFALYLVVADTEDRGVLLKLPGRLDLDPVSGQISASFENLPQLPFDQLDLSFRSGTRAPLLSGPACGPQTIVASVSSWARPADPVSLADSHAINEGPTGAPCAPAANRPFAPQLSAGTINPSAAARTPFVFKLTRGDAEQPLGKVAATLPPGLLADTTAIPICPEEAIAAIPSGEGSAHRQLAEPSCPAASRLGSATIAAGAGPEPLYLSGAIYLAGPYRGAPFSLVVVVPALAGPFDLGTLTSRIAVDVDSSSAQLRLASDPLPTILAGIPIDLRAIRLELDRPGLIRNPTSCKETSLSGIATSEQGTTAPITDRFQVGSCSELALKPRLHLRLSGGLGRNAHPTATFDVDPRPGDANLRTASLSLPYGLFIDPARLRSACPLRLFTEHSCPPSARLGWAQVTSPLLPDPDRGRLFMVEGPGRLPDIAASLGGDVPLDLRGHLDARYTRIRASFDSLPDIPLSHLHLVLKGGFRGLLVNSDGLCSRRPPLVRASFVGHNSKRRRSRARATLRCQR